jgi:hypothetical protein
MWFSCTASASSGAYRGCAWGFCAVAIASAALGRRHAQLARSRVGM